MNEEKMSQRQYIRHFGVMGMHWGKVKAKFNEARDYVKTANLADKNEQDIVDALTARRKKGFSSKMTRRMSDKEINDLAASPAMAKHISDFKQARTKSRQQLLMSLAVFAVAYSTLTLASKPHPKMTIHFDRRPRQPDPFFKATIRKVVPKLLPGG